MSKITTESIQRDSIKNRLSSLYVERADLLGRIEAVDDMIKFFEEKYYESNSLGKSSNYYVTDAQSRLSVIQTADISSNYIVEDIEQEIVYVISEIIKKSALMGEIEIVYENLFKSKQKLGNYLRKLKRNKRVIAIRYNRANQLTFWGTPEMLNVYKTDYEHEFKRNHLLPNPLKSVEIL